MRGRRAPRLRGAERTRKVESRPDRAIARSRRQLGELLQRGGSRTGRPHPSDPRVHRGLPLRRPRDRRQQARAARAQHDGRPGAAAFEERVTGRGRRAARRRAPLGAGELHRVQRPRAAPAPDALDRGRVAALPFSGASRGDAAAATWTFRARDARRSRSSTRTSTARRRRSSRTCWAWRSSARPSRATRSSGPTRGSRTRAASCTRGRRSTTSRSSRRCCRSRSSPGPSIGGPTSSARGSSPTTGPRSVGVSAPKIERVCGFDAAGARARRRRGVRDVDIPWRRSRGDAAARDVDIPWRRVAATPRGEVATTPRGEVAATKSPRRTRGRRRISARRRLRHDVDRDQRHRERPQAPRRRRLGRRRHGRRPAEEGRPRPRRAHRYDRVRKKKISSRSERVAATPWRGHADSPRIWDRPRTSVAVVGGTPERGDTRVMSPPWETGGGGRLSRLPGSRPEDQGPRAKGAPLTSWCCNLFA